MDQLGWYKKAEAKVREFLPEIDEYLTVRVRLVRVTSTPGKPYAEYRSELALVFAHRVNTEVRWSMEIITNNDYIENKLQAVVTSILQEQRGW